MSSQIVDTSSMLPRHLDTSADMLNTSLVGSEETVSPWLAFLRATEHGNENRMVYVLGIKRVIDMVGATFLLIIFSPLLLIIALLIRYNSRGPVLFRQQRIGRFGKPFEMLKIRTMVGERRSTKSATCPGPERRNRHKSRQDPRVTGVGKLLRMSSLDELPQLINILRGEMSFIGPRPELPSIVKTYAPWQHERHLVMPGLSGWWQVNGRSDKPMHEHTELDIYYVRHQSFHLDCLIFVRTFKAVLKLSGAY